MLSYKVAKTLGTACLEVQTCKTLFAVQLLFLARYTHDLMVCRNSKEGKKIPLFYDCLSKHAALYPYGLKQYHTS